MSENEILQLEGRRLDAAIAKHIFKWKDVREEAGDFIGTEFGTVESAIPYFSYDMNLAWKVVEVMAKKGFVFTLMLHYDTPNGMVVPFPVSATFQKAREYSANGSDPAVAICRAALLAFFGEVV